MLERGWYLINDEELFLFAANGFWDREERMQTYRNVKERYCGKDIPGMPPLPEHQPVEQPAANGREDKETHWYDPLMGFIILFFFGLLIFVIVPDIIRVILTGAS